MKVVRASGAYLQADLALDYLGKGEVTLGLKINRGDSELVEAMKPLEALLLKRARAALAHIHS